MGEEQNIIKKIRKDLPHLQARDIKKIEEGFRILQLQQLKPEQAVQTLPIDALITAQFQSFQNTIKQAINEASINNQVQIKELSTKIDSLEKKIEGKIDKTNERIDSLETKLEGKMNSLEAKLEGKMDSLETKLEEKIDKTNERIDSLEAKFDKKIDIIQNDTKDIYKEIGNVKGTIGDTKAELVKSIGETKATLEKSIRVTATSGILAVAALMGVFIAISKYYMQTVK